MTANPNAQVKLSWAAEGEDILALQMFKRLFPGQREPGIYIDIGAHHPFHNSNTALLHSLGWMGVNADPMPGCMEAFETARPFDHNQEVGVAAKAGIGRYCRFDRPELNYLQNSDAEMATTIHRGAFFQDAVQVPVVTPKELLQDIQHVDFLNLDIEGSELAVLKAWPWDVPELRPKVICVEAHMDHLAIRHVFQCDCEGAYSMDDLEYKLLNEDYVPVSRLLCSTFYVDASRAVWR